MGYMHLAVTLAAINDFKYEVPTALDVFHAAFKRFEV